MRETIRSGNNTIPEPYNGEIPYNEGNTYCGIQYHAENRNNTIQDPQTMRYRRCNQNKLRARTIERGNEKEEKRKNIRKGKGKGRVASRLW
jgi:hypothetical protein